MQSKAVCLLLLLTAGRAVAQQPDYAAAEKYEASHLQELAGSLQQVPFFVKGDSSFWYRQALPGEKKDVYYMVDPRAKTKTLLSKVPEGGPFKKVFHSDVSPDTLWELYAEQHNLYLMKRNDSSFRQLTHTGEVYHSFASVADRDDMKGHMITDAVWSRDSRHFCMLRKDSRKVGTMTVLNSLFYGRPYINTYKYEWPMDTAVTQYEMYIGSTTADSLYKVNLTRWPDQEVQLITTKQPGEEMFLIRRKRTRDEMELCAVNMTTGVLRVVIHEESKPVINEDMFQVVIVNEGRDIFWWSDRTGWGQYYHYNREGRLLNALTQGNWTAGKLCATDTVKRCVYLYGYGREKERNPYYSFLYKVNFDGTGFTLLTPENATHHVFLSPKLDYLIDNYSRIDMPPGSVVRNMKGELMMEFFKADVSKLYAYGWKAPEPFIVKAKDGVTDLYGLMWKPFNFDSTKKYPVISQVYPGPQIETVWSEFTVTDRYNNTALAQMGFIVVCMGHRGNSPIRNAAYYKYGHGNLRDYALEDDKYGLEQLGSRFAYIDLNRVGIFGHSGGGMMTVAAMGTYPDFYKAGVASSGNHDNKIYNRTWGEVYQGFDKPYTNNQSLAANIKGSLMLVAGESDANVNPAHTMRMADALIHAGKDFDLLLLPGQSHTYEGVYKTYYEKRLRSFFAKHLLQ